MPKKETFISRQGEGGYPKNLKFGETSFMDGPFLKMVFLSLEMNVMKSLWHFLAFFGHIVSGK